MVNACVTRLRCTRAPLCFVPFCGCSDCVTVILVWLLHHVWNSHLVGLLRSSAYQNIATLHFVSTRLCVLNCQCQPFSSQATCFLRVQGDGFKRGQMFARDEQSKRVLIQYNRTQLLNMTPARLTPDLISHLRSLHIGVDLPRKWSRRGGTRKQKQSKQSNHLPPSTLSLIDQRRSRLSKR